MKRFYTIAILILSALTLRALQVDTVAMQQLIASGQRALCTAIEHNNTLRKAGATTGYRFFVAPDPPAPTNARVEFVGAQKGSSIPQYVIDTLNARCSRDYVQFGVELFLIHINSLDVIVNGQMPQTVNLRDLLVNGLYDEQSNLDSLRKLHKEISSRIVSGVALNLNRTSLFYIVGDYCGVFTPTGKEGCWRYARVSSFAGPGQIGDHAGEFRDNLFRRVENIGSMLLPDRLIAVENEFRESMTMYNQRQLITSSFHPNFLNAIFENFDTDAFADLTLGQRLHALHVYSGYPMLSAWLGANGEEHFVLQIIKTAPPDQAKGLLQGMESPSTAIEGNNAYSGTKGGEALIYKLVDRTDDAIVAGPNNYQLLMKYVSATCTKSPQAIDYCVAATDVAQFNTVINWKNNDLLAVPPVGHIKYFVDFLSNGKVSYTFQNVLGYGNTPGPSGPTTTTLWSQSSTPIELSPFSFIILNNTSGLSMIGDVMNGPGAQMVPAVMLKYCADKQFNDQAITACAVALDIVGVVTGPGLITAALRAGRLAVAAFEAVQLLGAVGNLVANSSASPNLQAVVNKYNAIVGIWGLTRIATSGARYTADYFTAAKQNNLATISETVALEYEVLYNTAKTDIDAAPEAVKGPLDKMKKLVGKGVSGALEMVRGVSRQEFIASVADFSKPENAHLVDQAWTLWKREKWSDLETYFQTSNINFDPAIQKVWPPMFGFKQVNYSKSGSELNDLIFDRFQKESSLGGSFASPIINNSPYTLQARALGVNYDDMIDLGQNYYYFKFRFTNAPSNLTMSFGEAAPWFGDLGGAMQVKSSIGFHNLSGQLEIVEKWLFSNGQWTRLQ
jgi:hypothetical protein